MRKRINLLEPETEYRTLYHSSPASNRFRISKQGLRGRDKSYYKRLITNLGKEYGISEEDIPTKYKRKQWRKNFELNRDYYLKHKQSIVHTSPSEQYSIVNALAGKEAEMELRQKFEKLKGKYKGTSQREIFEKMVPPGKKRQIDIYKLRVPRKDVISESWGGLDVMVKNVPIEQIKSRKTASQWDEHQLPYRNKRKRITRREK